MGGDTAMKQDRMTSRERVLCTLAFHEPDRVPLNTRIGDPEIVRLARAALGDAADRYLEGDVAIVQFEATTNDPVFRKYLGNLPEGARIDNWGVGVVPQRDSSGRTLASLEIGPLRDMTSLDELKEFPFPDMTEAWRHARLDEKIKDLRRKNKAIAGQMSQTILETAYRMRGMDKLFMDFYANPEFVTYLFDRLAEARVFMARRFAEAGVDILRIGDDIGTQRSLLVSPRTYREWIKERHRAVIAAARRVAPQIPVLYHSDGNIEQIIPDLIEVGVTALNPVQPECMDPVHIKAEFGDRITLWGTISTQTTIAFGSRDDVRNEVRARKETVGGKGGLIFDLINVAYSQKARENIAAFIEAVHEFGWYDM